MTDISAAGVVNGVNVPTTGRHARRTLGDVHGLVVESGMWESTAASIFSVSMPYTYIHLYISVSG